MGPRWAASERGVLSDIRTGCDLHTPFFYMSFFKREIALLSAIQGEGLEEWRKEKYVV